MAKRLPTFRLQNSIGGLLFYRKICSFFSIWEKTYMKKVQPVAQSARGTDAYEGTSSTPPPQLQLSHILHLCISPSRAVFLLSSLLGPGLWVKNGNNVQVGAVRPRLVSGLCICKDLSPRAALSPLLPLWGQSPENIWATPPPAGTSSLVQYAGMVIMPIIWDIKTFYWYKKCWPRVLSHCTGAMQKCNWQN